MFDTLYRALRLVRNPPLTMSRGSSHRQKVVETGRRMVLKNAWSEARQMIPCICKFREGWRRCRLTTYSQCVSNLKNVISPRSEGQVKWQNWCSFCGAETSMIGSAMSAATPNFQIIRESVFWGRRHVSRYFPEKQAKQFYRGRSLQTGVKEPSQPARPFLWRGQFNVYESGRLPSLDILTGTHASAHREICLHGRSKKRWGTGPNVENALSINLALSLGQPSTLDAMFLPVPRKIGERSRWLNMEICLQQQYGKAQI